MRTVVLALAAAAALVACSKRDVAGEKPAASASAAKGAIPSVPRRGASARAAPAPLSADEVEKLVHAWQRSQNDADFARYETLYAERFTGVKRAGNTARSFGRAGWLADRKKMFDKPMQVGVDDVSIAVSGVTARVELQQTWSSGTYSDSGRKQMVITATPAGPRIAREEMLESKLAGTPPATALAKLVLADDDGIVLHPRPLDAWSKGAIRPGRQRGIAVTDVNEAALPPELAAWKGRSVRVADKAGSTCTAKVTGFALRTSVVPHFGMLEDWSGRLGGPVLTPSQIAGEIWKLGERNGRSLIGVLSPVCSGAWALEAGERTPPTGSIADASAEQKRRAVVALRKLPAWSEIQKDFVAKKPSAKGAWDEAPDAFLHVYRIEVPPAPALVMVTASATDGCEDFGGLIDAVFREGAAGELALVGVLESPNGSNFMPEAAFDLDGDGALELLLRGGHSTRRALYAKGANGHELRVLFEEPYFDCPC